MESRGAKEETELKSLVLGTSSSESGRRSREKPGPLTLEARASGGESDTTETSTSMDIDDDRRPLKSHVREGRKKMYGSASHRPASPERRWTFARLLQFLKLKRADTCSPPRTIHISDHAANHSQKFCSNRISTTKYNILTFLPLFLFDQFRRLANLFFLIVVLLQQIPGVSPTGRYTTAVPLLLVMLAIAAKEIIEDIRRFRADNKVNRRIVIVIRDGREERVQWTKVLVGDIVRVENKEFFPSDLLLLSTSEPQGLCYVETSNLDGETNLKIKQAHPRTTERTSIEQLEELRGGRVECEGPNNRLYEFSGNLYLQGQKPERVQADQILLRGSQLRNTDFVFGLVLYTGHSSKLLRNARRAPLKRSNMDNVTNKQIILLIFLLLLLSLISSIGAIVWNGSHSGHWYLTLPENTGSKARDFFKSILTFGILYNNLVPISLIVTLEIVKFIQAIFINYDREMYHAATDTPALVRNSNLNEELGQVQYIFADKTGTLTENIMEFKKCSIAGQIYSIDPPIDSTEEEEFTTLGLVEAIQGGSSQPTLLDFMRALALCHSVIPEREEQKDGSTHLTYRAASPDEEALVEAARRLGVTFEVRTPTSVTINVRGVKEVYEVLNLLEFNSTRKRMSVILRAPNGEIVLYCKGADSVIYPRLKQGEIFSQETEQHLKHFAIDGLRTLCIAVATIDEAAYHEWNRVYYNASITTADKEQQLDDAAELIEKELHLLGATAIEDKLQAAVPESIALLRQAGIRVWVLTGDKQETAINIGFASRQLSPDMRLHIINESTLEDVERRISDCSAECDVQGHNMCNAATIIDGKSLTFALDDRLRKKFLALALICKSVICCRVSPLQKANVVKLVREKVKKSITLAIGDGANDVSMIQAAHVGVGISGREGLQATLASDYAIAQFRFLTRLLLVHGAWSYNRLSKVILYSFYKNITLYFIEFWFAFYNGFSGQPMFERWTIGLYNVLFTSIPPFTLGILDIDVSAAGRLDHPNLYQHSQLGRGFNIKVFWKWIFYSIYHSFVLYFAIYWLLSSEMAFENGKVFGLWYAGNTVYTAVVICVSLKAGLETDFWSVFAHIAIWGSIGVWFLFVLVYSHFWPTFPLAVEMVGQDQKLYSSVVFYGLFVLAPAIALLPDFTWTSYQKTFWPTNIDRVREKEIRYCRSRRLNEYEPLNGVSVSYTVSGNATGYGDGLEDAGGSKALGYHDDTTEEQAPTHGYAFSQEDHGHLRKFEDSA